MWKKVIQNNYNDGDGHSHVLFVCSKLNITFILHHLPPLLSMIIEKGLPRFIFWEY